LVELQGFNRFVSNS